MVRDKGDAEEDKEGIQFAKAPGRRMAWIMKIIQK